MNEEDEEDETFEVKLYCRNCEHEWIEDVDRGVYIRYKKDNNYMIEDRGKGKRKYFKCPNCGAKKKIARMPLKDYRGWKEKNSNTKRRKKPIW